MEQRVKVVFFGGVSYPKRLLCLSTYCSPIDRACSTSTLLTLWLVQPDNFNRANLPLDLLCQDIPIVYWKSLHFIWKHNNQSLFLEVRCENLVVNTSHYDKGLGNSIGSFSFHWRISCLYSVCELHPHMALLSTLMRPKHSSSSSSSSLPVWPLAIRLHVIDAFPSRDHKQTSSASESYTLPAWDWIHCGTHFRNRFLTVSSYVYKML